METRKETIKRLAKEEAKANRLNYPTIALEEAAFIRGAAWADEHPIHYDGQAMLYVLHKGVEQGKKEMLEKAIKWLKENEDHYAIECEDTCFSAHLTDDFIEDFRKAMEE